MEAVLIPIAIALFGNKFIELLKYLRTRDWNGALTLLSLFVAGFVTLTLAAHSAATQYWTIPGTTIPLGMLDGGSLVLLGLMLTATGSTIYDYKKSLDGSDSAAQPKLFGPGRQTPPEG